VLFLLNLYNYYHKASCSKANIHFIGLERRRLHVFRALHRAKSAGIEKHVQSALLSRMPAATSTTFDMRHRRRTHERANRSASSRPADLSVQSKQNGEEHKSSMKHLTPKECNNASQFQLP